jgi:hypothetical protein
MTRIVPPTTVAVLRGDRALSVTWTLSTPLCLFLSHLAKTHRLEFVHFSSLSLFAINDTWTTDCFPSIPVSCRFDTFGVRHGLC